MQPSLTIFANFNIDGKFLTEINNPCIISDGVITSINDLPSMNNQNVNLQQQMMSQQPQNIILNRSETISTNNNQMTTSNYNQLIPSGGSNTNNPITMENNNQNQTQAPNYNELISQLQKASAYGATTMPSRDIPMEPAKIMNDVQSGKGSLGKIVKDDALYNNLEKTSKELELLLQDLRLNPARYINVSLFGKKNKPYKTPIDSIKNTKN